jgi:hypothetical protein
MDPGSFSVIAYETAPRWLAELERLKLLVRASFEPRQLETSGRFGGGYRSLEECQRQS